MYIQNSQSEKLEINKTITFKYETRALGVSKYTHYATTCTSLVLARPRKYEMNSRKLKIKNIYLYHSYVHEVKIKVTCHKLEWIYSNQGVCYISLLFYYSIDHDVQINCST